MKQVSQLDKDGYFLGLTIADESPLEPGVFLIPGGAIDAPAPVLPEGQRAKWDGQWVFEDIPEPEPEYEPEPEPEPEPEIEPIELLRKERNYRISKTDWWASSDLTMTQKQIDYRQALRDITDTYTSLDDVVWPEMP